MLANGSRGTDDEQRLGARDMRDRAELVGGDRDTARLELMISPL